MSAEHNKAYDNFKKYNEGLKGISIYEEVEGGSEIHQCKFFIDYLIANPRIKKVNTSKRESNINQCFIFRLLRVVAAISVNL
jgi:hypothetical protein